MSASPGETRMRNVRAGLAVLAVAAALGVAGQLMAPGLASASSLQLSNLTLKVPSTATSGSQITLSGYLMDTSDGRRLSYGTVNIYDAVPGAAQWTRLNSVRTNSTGFYTDTITVHSTVYFYASFQQVARFGGVHTGSAMVDVGLANGTTEAGSDGCDYLVVNGAWQGQYCLRQATDADGQALADQYLIFNFDASTANHLGAADFVWDPALSSGQYFVVRAAGLPSDVAWLALPLMPKEPDLVDSDAGGQYAWLTLAQYASDHAGTATTNNSTTTVVIGGDGSIYPGFQSLVNGTGINLNQLLAQEGSNPVLDGLINTVQTNALTWVTDGTYTLDTDERRHRGEFEGDLTPPSR